MNKLLKLDPTNTTLLAQKQELLKSAVGETKNKLTQLKSVQDQMDAGLKNGSVTQQQYDAWRREIIETEQELKNLGKEAKNPTLYLRHPQADREQATGSGRKNLSLR